MTKRTKAPIAKRELRKQTSDIFANLRPLPPHPAAALIGLAIDPDSRPAPDKPDALSGFQDPLLAFQVPADAASPGAPSGGSTPPPSGGSTPSPSGGSTPENLVGVHAEVVGAFTPTKIEKVGAFTPTTERGVRTPRGKSASRKGDRHDADRQKVNFYLHRDKVKEFSVFATMHDLTLTEFFERAGIHFMACVGVHQANVVGVNTPHDDLTINDTHEDIIRLYKELTGNRWKPADDQLGKRFNRADRRHVELGMLYTFLRFKGKRINSFKYFLPEIENMLEELRGAKMSDETLDYLLRHRREQAKAKRGG